MFTELNVVLAQTAIANYHRLGVLNNGNVYFEVLRLKDQDQGANMVGFLCELSSRLVDGHLLTVAAQGWGEGGARRETAALSSLL